jgi:hypothetical protein
MTQFKVLFRHWCGKNEDYDGNISEGSWYLVQDLNQRPPKFRAVALPTVKFRNLFFVLMCIFACLNNRMTVRSNQTTVTRRSLKREWVNGVWRKVPSQLRMIDETSTAVSEKCAVLTSRRMQQHVCRSSTGRPDSKQRPRVVLHRLSLPPRTQCNMNWPVSPWATQLSFHYTLHARYYRQCEKETSAANSLRAPR